MQPVVVWRGGAGTETESAPWLIVHGFRRAEAARRLGWAEVPALALPPDWTEREVFLAGLQLFLATDAPNPVEISIVLHKLERYFDRDEIIGRFLPMLGLQPAGVLHRRYRGILELPEAACLALADGTLDPACASYLELFHPAERAPAVALVLLLRPSRSLQKEFLELLHDLTQRDNQTVEQIIAASPVAERWDEILRIGGGGGHVDASGKGPGGDSKRERVDEATARDTENLPQLREQFRRWLRARRFPVLTEQERRFEDVRRDLALDPAITLSPPPWFEGGRYEVRFSFSSPDELLRLIESLDSLRRNIGTLDKLWR
ncbi:MAG: hypothetical protein Kow0059_06970 [Candidatus Sumerlaeia bacterium]